ncbi:rhomboid family intramembrane serine protease [Maribacter algarum]|uniref:Rhomboid family intramembrane serine protease n=1 Tax=Maribacter algarum (ex Zhang et al. 2020) TaxID=2578118 RepID=A0A5S3PR52_9FLAO|nr:rhomboid family intramembrane serine protease [Maribacter algarum]TMM57226.1 rhomboid family intramembrane serine protease [Maribacter algarum]
MGGIDLVTLIIIGANVLISFKGFNDNVFFDRYKFQVAPINSGQKERILSSGFLHVDMTHLLFNMLTLYFFADEVIRGFGPSKFLIIYFVSLIAGSLLALFFHKDEPYYSAVGASGAVTGILYSAILLRPGMELLLYFAIPIPAYVLGIGYLLYSIYGMKKRLGNIGHTAHFGGAVGGYAATLLFDTDLIFTSTLMVILLAIPIIILFVMEKMGKI